MGNEALVRGSQLARLLSFFNQAKKRDLGLGPELVDRSHRGAPQHDTQVKHGWLLTGIHLDKGRKTKE